MARPALRQASRTDNAVALGQADVEHDRVIGLGVAEKPALLAVEGAVDRVARRLQRRHDLSVEIAIVFDNKKAHGSRFFLSDHIFGIGSRALRAPMSLPVAAFMTTWTSRPSRCNKRNFIDEFVAETAELGRQRLRLELRRGGFEDGERLVKMAGLDFLAGFVRRQARRA